MHSAISPSLLAGARAVRVSSRPRCARWQFAMADFWNLAHPARIRVFLEQAIGKAAWFSRSAAREGVTIEVIFGTANRVSHRCSKNPKMASACPAKLACPEQCRGARSTLCRKARSIFHRHVHAEVFDEE